MSKYEVSYGQVYCDGCNGFLCMMCDTHVDVTDDDAIAIPIDGMEVAFFCTSNCWRRFSEYWKERISQWEYHSNLVRTTFEK